MMSSGKIATPPQPIGSPQPTKVRPATEGGAAKPSHHTDRPVPSTPSTSRTTPSVISAATPRLTMRAHRMSPKMPASLTPIASTTAIQPCGIASIAVRVEIGDDQDSGVARSSRDGTKRNVKAGPTSRGNPGRSGLAPRIQTFRRPFFNRTVVMVPVDTRDRVATASGDRDIGNAGSGRGGREVAHLAGRGHRVKGLREMPRSQHLIGSMPINLLNLHADFVRSEFHSPAKRATGWG